MFKLFNNQRMQKNRFISLYLFSLMIMFVSCNQMIEPERSINPSLMLWYDEPANDWTEALPVGNGRLGAMIYGGKENEIIQFNEETLWSGQPHNYANQGAYKYLDDMRKLLWEGKQQEAQELGNAQFMSQPLGQMSYLPFGNVLLKFPGHSNSTSYQRRLNLENAISTVSYSVDGVRFKREVYSSAPAQALIIRLEASENKELNFTAKLNSPHSDYKVLVDGDEIILRGKANNPPLEKDSNGNPYPKSRLSFEARLKIETEGGGLVQYDDSIGIINARSATLYLVAATNFVDYNTIDANPAERCSQYIANLEGKPYQTLKEEHISDYRTLFQRVSIDLGTAEISGRPTDERLSSFTEDEDPSLISLLFQYGRYLLISSSRPGTQPANLQGIWNNKLSPPWGSKYTLNINTEMNYWPAEVTNLAECAEPLFSMVNDLTVTGKNIARRHYNLDGWVTHHNTDLWRGAAPVNDASHGIWPTGGAWLSQHLWWHYQYNGNRGFLRKSAYPVLKEASRFFAGYLVPRPENPEWLVSGPSNSPELGGLVMGPAIDHQIIRELFSNTIEAAEILEVDEAFAERLKLLRDSISPNQIGQHGQLQEWINDVDDPGEQHRHVSHLWGLYPGNEIHPLTTPALAEASKVTLLHRGDGGTGWSRAWKINLWARLLDGDHAFLLLKNLMEPSIITDTITHDRGGLYFNLFDSHPPFQIDGNFGATSGIAEMLLQSHLRDNNGDYYQDILPALPSKLVDGKISGIKGRGGFQFSITWENGKLVSIKAESVLGKKMKLRYRGKTVTRDTQAGATYLFGEGDFR